MDVPENEGDQDRRPTPVRAVMEGTEPEESEEHNPDFRTVIEPETGKEWIARVSGQSGSGILPLRVISLLEIAFSRPDEPEKPLRRAICQGRSLGDLREEDLLKLLGESRPVESPHPKDEARAQKGSRGRSRQNRKG